MEYVSKMALADAEKESFIANLTQNLTALRTHAGISQEDLANIVGISRQTYSAIERKVRKMSWSTYLCLVFFFDNNIKTHKMLRMLSLFPGALIERFNDGADSSTSSIHSILGSQAEEILECLDAKAKQKINSIIMVEYARCTQLPSEAVVMSFDGIDLLGSAPSSKDVEAARLLKTIRKKDANEE